MEKKIIIGFIGLILFVVVSFFLLIKKSKSTPISNDKDCIVKVTSSGTCTNGNYNIVYEISENNLGKGKDCLTVIKDIDPRPTYTFRNNQYVGTATCGDCDLKDLVIGACTDDKIKLTLDIQTPPGVIGTTCESIIASKYPNYKSVFKKEGNSYVADATCNTCDLTSTTPTTCGDCVLNSTVSYTDCTQNKQTLTLNVTTTPSVSGKSCESIIASTYPKYSSAFKKQGNSYIATDVECSNCNISSSSAKSVCVGNRGVTTYDVISNVISGYGTSCTDIASKTINPNAKYDSDNNIVYYYNTNSCIVNYSGNYFYRYGFDSNNKKAIGLPNTTPVMHFYFDIQDPLTSRLIGIEISSLFTFYAAGREDDYLLLDLGNGKYITVGKNSTIYNKPTSMEFPIRLYTDKSDSPDYIQQYSVVITAKWSGMDVKYLSWGISDIPLEFTFEVYDLKNNRRIAENIITYNIP